MPTRRWRNNTRKSLFCKRKAPRPKVAGPLPQRLKSHGHLGDQPADEATCIGRILTRSGSDSRSAYCTCFSAPRYGTTQTLALCLGRSASSSSWSRCKPVFSANLHISSAETNLVECSETDNTAISRTSFIFCLRNPEQE